MHRLVPAALAATLLAPFGIASPAHAANEIAVSMPGGVLFDTCGYYDFSYTAAIPAGYTYTWSADLELIGPDGNEVDTDYVYDDEATTASQFFLCDSPNLAGTYSIGGSGEACNSNYSCVPITVAPSTTTFRLPQTRTTLKARPLRPAKGQVVRFLVKSTDERPAGYFGTPYATVRLQVRRGGSWRTIEKTSTGDTGRAVVRARYTGRRAKVRAVTDGTSSRTGSVSRTVTVG